MVKILIADDHQMMIEGWRSILKNEEYIKVVGEVRSGQEIAEFLKRNEVDLLVTDIDMGSNADDGLQTIKLLREQEYSLPILVVSMHAEIGFIQEAIEFGANGYVLKSNSTDEMIKAIREIASGKSYFSQEVLRKLTGRMRRQNESELINLTPREKDVLPLLCKGFSSKKIADELMISHNTVSTYRKKIYLKFDINNISELINKARLLGYIK